MDKGTLIGIGISLISIGIAIYQAIVSKKFKDAVGIWGKDIYSKGLTELNSIRSLSTKIKNMDGIKWKTSQDMISSAIDERQKSFEGFMKSTETFINGTIKNMEKTREEENEA